MIIYPITELVIKLVIYVSLFSGVWILVKPYLKPQVFYTVRRLKNKSRRWILNPGNIGFRFQSNTIYRHVDMLLQSTWSFYTQTSVVNFFILSLGLFISTLTLYFRLTLSWSATITSCFFTAMLPYIVMRMRLQFIRTKTSYQLGPVVGILLASYRITNKNIYFAFLQTIKKLDSTLLKKSFIMLANHIQNHKNQKDIEKAIELFVFQIQTSWAKQLGVLLQSALIDGREIEQSLSNIVNDMKEGQKIIEQEKSNSHETILLGYLPVIAFPATIWFMTAMSGQFNILHHQFKTSQGLTSFILTAILCIIGFLIALFLRKPKNDL